MARRIRVIDRDRGMRKAMQRIRAVKGAHVRVGVTESVASDAKKTRSGTPSGLTLVEVAWFNEFGTVTAPERSFIRSTTDEQRNAIYRLKRALVKRIGKGELTVDAGLRILGEYMQGKIQKKIVDLRDPPNAESTKARKGSDNPLVDIGQLLQSIRYQVSPGG